MKIIHTADWHIGRTLFDYPLIDDQRLFLHWLADLAAAEEADAILIAGDLYNRAVPSAQAVELLDEIFCDLALKKRIPLYVIAGNHDSAERLSFCSRLLEEGGLHLCGSAAQRAHLPLEKDGVRVTFHLLPYFTPAEVRMLFPEKEIASFDEAFAALMEQDRPLLEPSSFHLLAAHGFFLKTGESGEPLFSKSELSVGAVDAMDLRHAEGYGYVALGHLHAPQRAGSNARYAGSPLKYSLSEARQRKSVTVLEIGRGGEIAVSERAYRPRRDVRVIEGDFEQLLDPRNQGGESLDDYVYANILGDEAVLFALQKLRAVFPNILGLQFTAPQGEEAAIPAGEALASEPVEALFERFYQQITGQELTEARRRIVLSAAEASRPLEPEK
ncbi:MAG: exonuclease SbcCD subunit D [Provencibacterium sp.]|jgi:exonuclease SbcD|nr:exonuclease SbcCD subunit D [Provencibacterium sp.]